MTDTANAGWVLPEDLHHLARNGGQRVVQDLIELFQQDVAHRLHLLREAVRNGDLAIVGLEAHSIKGSAVQLGANNLVATCRHMELDAAHRVTENLQRLLLEAEAEFRVLQVSMHS
jgi:HPt (histidine-containing phosphotransfer) domain-containing protein